MTSYTALIAAMVDRALFAYCRALPGRPCFWCFRWPAPGAVRGTRSRDPGAAAELALLLALLGLHGPFRSASEAEELVSRLGAARGVLAVCPHGVTGLTREPVALRDVSEAYRGVPWGPVLDEIRGTVPVR